MPGKKKGKAGLKKKQNKNKNKNKQQNNDPNNQKDKPESKTNDLINNNNNNSNNNDDGILDRNTLIAKYDIRLGPRGYIPGPFGASKSIHIEEFSMLDPGGGRELLTQTEIHIKEGSHYGLVGKNGFGKTTLLKLMNTYEIEGMPTHIRMILVNQEELISNATVLESVLKADVVRQQLLDEEDRLTTLQSETDDDDELELNELTELLAMIWEMQSELNFDQSEKRAMQILTGLGFDKLQMQSKTKDLSGGWQMRCKLAQALFVEPDLMLLDEPTNHLDFPTVLWLQHYLQNYEKTVIIVSHDRTFLNAACSHTIHLTQKKLLYYRGSYDTMLKTSKNELIDQIRQYDALDKQIKEIKAWIQKYKDKGQNMASQVQSKRKTLEKLEDEAELLAPPLAVQGLKFEFPDIGGLDDYICRMSDVSFKYPNMEKLLLDKITLQLDMDSRIAMIGANGVGKSTIVKLIMGSLDPVEGDCLRNRQAKIALFTQYHMDQLNLEQSAIEFICDKFGSTDEEMSKIKDKTQYARQRLGRFKLTGKQHTQKMKFLSGGQKSRVAFCVATWTQPHFLIMDEPTNHLDMETIDSLVLAISSFHGGVLVISHDQYFLQAAADQFWAVTPENIRLFDRFDDAKKFALKSRMEQIGDIADEDEEKTMDFNRKNYENMKQQRIDDKEKQKLDKIKGANKGNKKGGKKKNKK